MAEKILIVGGVAGGATAAARLRRLDEDAEIILFERGAYISYANCGLPYYIGGEIKQRKALFVATKESVVAKYHVDIRDLSEVTRIDRAKKEVEVLDHRSGESYRESYDKLLLSTGSSPFIPPIEGRDAKNVFSIWTIPDTDAIDQYIKEQQPRRAVVVGGGFIGLEMCENLAARGLEVSLLEMADQVMPPCDPEMARMVANHLVEKGVELRLGQGIAGISDDGKKILVKGGDALESDLTILCIGVRPNSELAREAGLELNERGGIVTDAFMRSSDPDIFAVGDASVVRDYLSGEPTMIPLAGPANKQGRAVAANVLGDLPQEPYLGSLGTSVAKVFDLTVAMTGKNEKQLKRQGLKLWEDYGIMLSHPLSHAGYYPGATPMSIKILYAMKDLSGNLRRGQILGAQIVGYEGVDKRIDTIATTLHFRGTVYDLSQLELAYAPPYSSAKDPVNLAGYAACNILDGLSHPISYGEWLQNPDDGRVLDVREDAEVAGGLMPGSLHIPLSRLREELDKLDKETLYYTVCAVGIRGYIAERILRQRGYRAKNLLGGTRHWKDMTASLDCVRAASQERASAAPHSDDGFILSQNPGATHLQPEEHGGQSKMNERSKELDVCGLSCPGPIVQVAAELKEMKDGDLLCVTATDPGFVRDIECWCRNTGNTLISQESEKGRFRARIRKGREADAASSAGASPLMNPDRAVAECFCSTTAARKEKTMIVFSGDLDKAIASFIIANGAAAMGNKVNMFFTFWGLNILRKAEKQPVAKDFMSRMFAAMMPRGSRKLGLSRMNFAGAGAKMIRGVMKKKNISSLEELIRQAQAAGVRLTACQMSMDVMGICQEELIDGVDIGGVAAMLDDNDRSNMNLFI